MHFNTRYLGLAVLAMLVGCHRLNMQLVDASVQKPSNVAVYFALDDENGDPLPGVQAEQFKIYEDDKLISPYESKQTILNPEVAIERYTLLLLDMSGSVVDSGQVPLVQQAVATFLENIQENEKIAIYAFDGRKNILPMAPFGAREAMLQRRNELLASFEPKDPSTNLNGAVIQAVEELKKAMDRSTVPLRFGTLVIFTDGTDRAHRATEEEALAALKDNHISSFVIGLDSEGDAQQAQVYATSGFVTAADQDKLVDSFKQVADKINAHAQRYYLLSYCSPSRAGEHELRVEVEVGEQSGALRYQFSAEGFKAGCDPTDAPKFEPPEMGTEETGGEKADDRPSVKKKHRQKKKTAKARASADAAASPPPPEVGF